MTQLEFTPAVPKSQTRRRSTSCLLYGARVALNADRAIPADIHIINGRIHEICEPRRMEAAAKSRLIRTVTTAIDLRGYLLLPGLINAHDHLEFNLFPRLGGGPYANYHDWAIEICRPKESPIHDHLAVPKSVRLWFGAVKNLLSGVTTVCHHNPPLTREFSKSLPVRIVNNFGWAHSLAFGRDIRAAYDATPPDSPFIIHLAEGTDRRSREEIFQLDRLGVLQSNFVAVHGVGLGRRGHILLEERRAGLICCPTSNQFTLGKTLSRKVVEHLQNAALGSDSALTAQGDLLDEIRVLNEQLRVGKRRTYSMVTDSAAKLLRLRNGEGSIRIGGCADFVVLPDNGQPPAARLSQLVAPDVQAVIVAGRPRLVSPEAAGVWPREALERFEVIRVNGVERLIQAPVRKLLESARRHLGVKVFLAGKRIMA